MTCPECALELYEDDGKKICPGCGKEYGMSKDKRGRDGGWHKSRIYNIWRSMRKRCLNKTDKDYFRYGGRGINICERWNEFENFINDMGIPPSNKHSLDRIDNNKGYSPYNCRWATQKEQQRNGSMAIWITVGGIRKTLKEWAEIKGIHPHTMRTRYKAGWTPERIINEPVMKSKGKRPYLSDAAGKPILDLDNIEPAPEVEEGEM